jgi:DNA mismatch repair ATPase MutL
MFAMRACRKSVMVGKALPMKAMEKIVRHMVGICVASVEEKVG